MNWYKTYNVVLILVGLVVNVKLCLLLNLIEMYQVILVVNSYLYKTNLSIYKKIK